MAGYLLCLFDCLLFPTLFPLSYSTLISYPLLYTLLHSFMPSPLLNILLYSALLFPTPSPLLLRYALPCPIPPYPISTLLPTPHLLPSPLPLKRKPNPRHNRMISNPPLLCSKRLDHCINMQCITGLHSAKVSIAIAYIH